MSAVKPISKPDITFQQIVDPYVRKNFENLYKYFQEQNQLLDFKFFESVFTDAKDGVQIAHGLGYVPLDILVTRITGPGSVTFKYGSFDATNLVVDVSGPCRIRFLAGTYSKLATAASTRFDDTQQVLPGGLTGASVQFPLTAAQLLSGQFQGSTQFLYWVRPNLDSVILGDCTTGNLFALLPLPALMKNRFLWFMKLDTTASTFTIKTSTVAAFRVLVGPTESALIHCDGITYRVLA